MGSVEPITGWLAFPHILKLCRGACAHVRVCARHSCLRFRASLAAVAGCIAGLSLVLLTASAPLLAAEVPAGDPEFELEEIIVTAPSPDGTLRLSPRSITVISAEDLRKSTATNVIEVLRLKANLNLQSFSGSEKFATIDIRGMGATAVSNVLVLVDGLRINSDDLAGPDLAAIPLSQIERIEIVRGGSGVRHGNGAVGGVINLITRRGKPGAKPRLSGFARRGAYDTDEVRLHASGSLGPLTASLTASDYASDGYRKNEALDKRDYAVDLQLYPVDTLEFFLRGASHHDRYGLPGPVSLADFRASERTRRATARPFDGGSTVDNRYVVGGSFTTGNFGQLRATASYRDRDNPYFIGFNPIGLAADQQNRIDARARTGEVSYELPLPLWGLHHTLTGGIDWNAADYTRAENGVAVAGSSQRRTGDLSERGYFIDSLIAAPFGVTFSLGYRQDRFASSQRDKRLTQQCETVIETRLVTINGPFGSFQIPLGIPVQRNCVTAFRLQDATRGHWENEAFNFGATWQATDALTFYVSANQSFRNPNVDELLFAVNDLRPQRGRSVDTGVRYQFSQLLEVSLNAFYLQVKDEIFFGLDPVTGQSRNLNLDAPTRRLGGEFEIQVRPTENLAVKGGVGYVRPQLDGGSADIPLVPRLTANLNLEWQATRWSQFALSTSYVGRRFDGNDFTNTEFAALPAYVVCDAQIRIMLGHVEVFGGINNLFGKVYSTIAYSNTVYPMPGRNAYVGIRVEF